MGGLLLLQLPLQVLLGLLSEVNKMSVQIPN